MPKSNKQQLIESGIKKIVMKVISEMNQPEILWQKSGWTIKKYQNRKGTDSLSVENDKSGFIDYPIYYDHNGKIAYDYPERVPNAIKKQVEKLYQTIR